MRLEGTLPHVLAAPAADPTLASFYQLTWWLVLLKVVVVFVFLLLTTMFMIWAERRVIARMQNRSVIPAVRWPSRARSADRLSSTRFIKVASGQSRANEASIG